MMLVCIDNTDLVSNVLTIGKHYELIDDQGFHPDSCFGIIDDTGEVGRYLKTRFKSLRDENLEKLLD